MKYLLIFSLTLTSLFATAAEDDLLITISTVGPDTYLDGTTVLNGECYALCWSLDGNFEGIAANGTAVDPDDKVVQVVGIAKKGKCPYSLFQIPSTEAAKLAGGQYCVFLLDTRVKSASGSVTVGVQNLVNATGSLGVSVAATSGLSSSMSDISKTSGSVVASTVAPAPAGVAQPKITGIRIADELAYISVESEDGSPLATTLAVSCTQALENGFIGTEANAADEKGSTTATLVRPATDAAGFFKVQGL